MRRAPRSLLGWLSFAGVAMGQDPATLDRSVLHHLHSADPAERAAAEAIVRAAAKWGIEHGDASLFAPTGEPEPRQRFGAGGYPMHGSPARRPRIDNVFALVPALRDERVEVRAAAVVELRDQLGAWQRPGALAAMGPTPVWWLAKHWRQVEVPAELLPHIVAEAKAGCAHAALQGKFTSLEALTARRFAVELVQAVTALGEDAPGSRPNAGYGRGIPPIFVPRGPIDELAAAALRVALEVHPLAASLLFGHAVQAHDDTLRRRVMAALWARGEKLERDGGSFPTEVALMASVMLGPVDAGYRVAAARALWLADRLPGAERDNLTQLALVQLPNVGSLTAATALSAYPLKGPAWAPQTMPELLVAVAAKHDPAMLRDPLLARFLATDARQSPGVRLSLAHLLALTVATADEQQLRRLHAAAFATKHSGPQWGRDGGEVLAEALFEFVPEDLFAAYGLADSDRLPPELQRRLEARSGPLPPHLVGWLMQLDPLYTQWGRLLPRAPQMLLMAIDAGDEPRARRLGGACTADVLRTLLPELLQRDPAAVAAAMLEPGDRDRSLQLLAHCRHVPKAWPLLAERIAAASVEPDELRWLRLLCAIDHAESAAAAAIRAHRHGDEGHELWKETVARLGGGEVHAPGQALHAMLSVGEALDDWREIAERARPHDWLLVEAAEIRFGGAAIDVELHNLCAVLRHARVTLDAATVRALAPQGEDLENLLASIDGSRVAVLEYLAELALWTRQLQDQVIRLCDDPDPAVRRAAYLALKSRDPELWPCAWLVCEAEFDRDPTVRAVAK